VNLIPEPEITLEHFKSLFLDIINKHAPFRKYKIKGHDNPWFSEKLSDLIHDRDLAWSMENPKLSKKRKKKIKEIHQLFRMAIL